MNPSAPSDAATRGPLEAPADPTEWLLRAAILAGLGGLCWLTFWTRSFSPLLAAVEEREWARLIERPSIVWSAMGTLLLVIRTGLWFRYRPAAASTLTDAPRLSVIIPAFNEGPMVARSIISAAEARYPRDRLEILVIDDGSTDDTWEHMQRAAALHPGVVTAHRLPRNMGKREALAAGIRRATGEVIVTIDSDSVIAPDALLEIAGPLRDERVGAVAGKVIVLNHDEGLIPRMLAVRFILSFDFLRAAQSTYGTVYCCPGALTAYRASAVRALLDRWLSQTFLGVPCTYGEDRGMTNLLLEAGFDTIYQRTAVVHTVVPRTFSKLSKMYLRWERSYIREELRYLRIVWSRPPRARVLSLLETAINNLRYPVSYAILILLAILLPARPIVLLRLLFVIGLFAAFNMLYYLRSERSTRCVYGVLYAYVAFFGLFWIFPYALVTVRARSWMTR